MWRANCALCLRLLERGRIRAWVSCQPRFCSNDAPESSTPSPPKANTSLRTKTEKQKRRQQKQTLILVSFVCIYFADTSVPFPLSYSPEYVEASWYQWWEKEGFFTPEYHDRVPHAQNRTFTMCVPPPNVTGSLHLGHALTVAIEDAMVRWKRMQGYRVLWVPGCDHAGIATQSVVEKRLLRDQRRRRQDLSREEFLQEVWTWKSQKGDEIYQQLRRLGASLDWSRACFTMDQGFSEAVTEAFVRLCDSGLIYRSEALVNWSCALESAISDIEVDSQELSGRTMLSVPGYERKVEFGTMVTFAYPLEGQDGEVAVATTRPETMLGDVAIAVHPDDPRYQAVQGKHCRHPFGDRLIPIVTDTMVDMQLGTGAVKVTPAHDHVDFELSRRHSLPCLTVISGDGTMAPSCGQWLEGVKRFDAREKVLDALAEKKLLRNKKDHAMSLPKCSRSGDVIEPLLKKQWFLRCEDMASRAIQAVEDGQLEIIPPLHIKTWKKWLSNTSDWCISRQLWWGHRIPAYQVALPVLRCVEQQARERAAAQCGVDPASLTLTQDPDVLDTWFSSALFPFAMLGWPQKTPDLQQFYPTSVLETGSDILFFWVARMVMLGTELTGQLPFKQVLLHSLVRDRHGRKMSKSLGNVVDPLDVIAGASLEVGGVTCLTREGAVGTWANSHQDTLARGLCMLALVEGSEPLCRSESSPQQSLNLCSTIMNCARELHMAHHCAIPRPSLVLPPSRSMDRWVCSRLHSTVLQCERGFEARELSAVTAAIHSFWVHSLCDVYMECIKPLLTQQDGGVGPGEALAGDVPLALLAPFMPYLSEELWQRLHPLLTRGAGGGSSSLCLQPFPRSSDLEHWHSPEEESHFLLVQEVVRVARSLRAQLWAVCSPAQEQTLLHFLPAVHTLSRVSTLHIHCPQGGPGARPSAPPPEGCIVGTVDHSCQLHLNVQVMTVYWKRPEQGSNNTGGDMFSL
uniref:Valine--tRNA ligase, mitochondrial n=1 Tax=Gadus morhua TaxID=8049 RepID=A0A8C5CIK5_GADMO